jgi:putative ABC transport system permease protein
MILLDPVDLILAAVLLLLLAAVDYMQKLGQTRNIIIAGTRTIIQLLLIGLTLKLLFEHANIWWVVLLSSIMLIAASREVRARQSRRFKGIYGYTLGATSMFLSSFTIALFALLVILQPDPWYAPQYAIPLLGMLLGNTMTGVSLSLERLTESIWKQKNTIEQKLMLGYTASEAIADIRRDSMRSGLIPIINAMTAAGIISLPGMMTGQILAGSDPFEAVKYQILILFLIAAGSGFGSVAAVWLGGKRLFDERQRLRLDRLIKPD